MLRIVNVYKFFAFFLLLLLPVTGSGQAVRCPEKKIASEQLPSLNVPRAGHSAFIADGELVVVGGHTSGFVPTPTAERYSGGVWRLMQTVYKHDFGFSVPLRSGKVMIGGGCEQNLGIGQTFSVELYDSRTHHFEGFGCLDRKRCFASAVEMDSGKVYITGNWYTEDGIECFSNSNIFGPVKGVSANRARPFIFRTSATDALIVSGTSSRDEAFDTLVIDRLHGEAFTSPLFTAWRIPHLIEEHPYDVGFIGNDAAGDYAYLFPVERKQDGQWAIARVRGGRFELLPTTVAVPMQRGGHRISYFTPVITDRQVGKGYLIGLDDEGRLYVVCVEYGQARDGGAAPLTLYYTSPHTDVGQGSALLTEDGDLIVAGGITDTNFAPHGGVVLLRVGSGRPTAAWYGSWRWAAAVGAALVMLCAIVLVLNARRRKRKAVTTGAEADLSPQPVSAAMPAEQEEYVRQLSRLMETERLYLDSKLRIGDVAKVLGIDSRTLSNSVMAVRGQTLSRFVNGYRIDYAKRILREQPATKIGSLYFEAGFNNEVSFFRTFKALTGMTPGEYAAQGGSEQAELREDEGDKEPKEF